MCVLSFRFYVDSMAESDCQKVILKIENTIAVSSNKKSVTIEKYWKIENYLEVSLEYDFYKMKLDDFILLTEKFSKKWEFEQIGDEKLAIWYQDIGSQINLPNVRWMLVTLS